MTPTPPSRPGASGPISGAEPLATVSSLAEDWRACQAKIAEIEARQDELFFSEQAQTSLFYRLDAERDALRQKALELLGRLSETQARCMAEVRLKMQLWKDIRFPTPDKSTDKNNVDQMVLSALSDLDALGVSDG
ncbi:MAG: hypothetical protein AAGH87_07515 [Pseudomonadota bacterium]